MTKYIKFIFLCIFLNACSTIYYKNALPLNGSVLDDFPQKVGGFYEIKDSANKDNEMIGVAQIEVVLLNSKRCQIFSQFVFQIEDLKKEKNKKKYKIENEILYEKVPLGVIDSSKSNQIEKSDLENSAISKEFVKIYPLSKLGSKYFYNRTLLSEIDLENKVIKVFSTDGQLNTSSIITYKSEFRKDKNGFYANISHKLVDGTNAYFVLSFEKSGADKFKFITPYSSVEIKEKLKEYNQITNFTAAGEDYLINPSESALKKLRYERNFFVEFNLQRVNNQNLFSIFTIRNSILFLGIILLILSIYLYLHNPRKNN